MFSPTLSKLLVLADTGSITTAASELCVSQPALSKTLQNLEHEIGAKIFHRVPKGVQPTKAGEILIHHARVMENEYRHAINRIAELTGSEQASLRVGAGPNWLVNILPTVVADFQQLHPDIRVSLDGGVIDTLLPALVSGDLDLICVPLDFPERTEIKQIALFEMNQIVVVDPTHPLAEKKNVTAKDLVVQRWLTLKSDKIGIQRIFSYFSTTGNEPPKISLETTSIHSLLETLRSGKYVAHIPEQMLELAQSKGLVKVNLNGALWRMSYGIAMRQTVEPSAALSSFIEIIKTATERFQTK